MSGITGVYKLPSSVSLETVCGTLKHLVPKLENRGQDGFGFVAFARQQGFWRYQSLRPAREFITADLNGHARDNTHAAIAHIRYPSSLETNDKDIQPIGSPDNSQNRITLSFSGALANGSELRQELSGQGVAFDGKTDAEILLRLIESICQRDYWNHNLPVDYEKLFREVDRRIDGAVSALILDGQGNLVAFRNQGGARPLEFMQTDDGFLLFASESHAFTDLHGKREEILPSHIKIIDGQTGEVHDRFVGNVRHAAKLCAYETLYLGNPKTFSRGQSHQTTRTNIGVALGKIMTPALQDELNNGSVVVSSMPRTGRPYADGVYDAFAQEQGALVQRHEVIELQSSRRTLIGIVAERKALIGQKYRVAEKHVTGKTIVIADEALIRGDTSQAISDMLFKAGAKAVHWAIGSPPIVAPNYYGIGIKTMDELAFWQVWKNLPADLKQKGFRLHNADNEALKIVEKQIASLIKATSVTYLPFETLVSLMPGGHERNDFSPFTLEMPTPAGQRRADRNLNKITAGLD